MNRPEAMTQTRVAPDPRSGRSRALSSSLRAAAQLLLAFGVLGPRAVPAQDPSAASADPRPDAASSELIHAMRDVPAGYSVPLYAVGDVNQDGAVDRTDHTLIEALARSDEATWPRIAEASCPGAADVDMNGVVDDQDAALAGELTADGALATPALFYQAALPCRFERLTVAVELFAVSGEQVELWLLRPGSSHRNTEVKVDSGPATVRPSDDDRVYLIEVSPDAATADTILLSIRFDPDEAYWLSLPVQAAGDGPPGEE